MIFSKTCAWCAVYETSWWPTRFRDFTAAHDRSCGASASLNWLDDAREVYVEDTGVRRLAAEVGTIHLDRVPELEAVDLRDAADDALPRAV